MWRKTRFVGCLLSVLVIVVVCPLVEAAPGREAFLASPDLLDAAISPSGQYLAEVWDKDDLRIVTVKDLKAEGVPVVGTASDKYSRAYAVNWANNERLLIKVRSPGNLKAVKRHENDDDFDIRNYRMFSRIIAMNPDATEQVVLLGDGHYTHHNRHLSRVTHYLPDDPDHVLMPNYRGYKLALSKVNVYTGDQELVSRGDRLTVGFIADSGGSLRYRLDYLYVAKRINILKLTDSGDWVEVDNIDFDERRENENLAVTEVAGLLDDELIYRKRNDKTGYYELVKYDSESKKTETLVSLEGKDVINVIIEPSTSKVIGFKYLDKVKRHKYFDKRDQALYDELAGYFEGENFFILSSANSSDLSVIYSYGLDNPGTYYLYDGDRKKLSLINYAYFSLTTDKLGIPVDAYYKSRDGTPIHTYLLFPPGYDPKKKYPLVVLPHGGPHSQDWATYDNFAQFLAARGYIVMKPNFRGSTGYGIEFEKAGYKQWGRIMQDDVTDGVKYMIEDGYADPDRVCIVGQSYGGYAALMGLIRTPKLFACAVSINGVTHLPDMVEYDEDVFDNPKLTERFVYSRVGHPEKDRKALLEYSPALLVENISSALLVIAGEKDEIVPVAQSELLVENLKKAGKEYRFVELEEVGHHVFSYWKSRERVYKEVEGFLDQYLGEKPESARIQQGGLPSSGSPQ